METVKVDIQKLQLLNDRIAQTIEALNQVRLSVQASQQQSSPMTASWGYAQPYGVYGQPQFVGQPTFQPGYGSPYAGHGHFGMSPFVGPQGYAGIQHTTPTTTPTTPWTTQTTPWTTPTTPWTTNGLTGWTTPWTANGLSHTTWDPSWQRTQQTFPFVQYPYVVW